MVVIYTILLLITQNNVAFCEPTIIDLSTNSNSNEDDDSMVKIYISPLDVDEHDPKSDSYVIGAKFRMHISAEIDDSKVKAEIKDNTLEWRLKSITFSYYDLKEAGAELTVGETEVKVSETEVIGDESKLVLIKEETFTSNAMLENYSNHPITVSRPLNEWGPNASWSIIDQLPTVDPITQLPQETKEGSTFNFPGNWEMKFEIEFRAKHNSIEDCMVQATVPKIKLIKWKYNVGMFVDTFAVEGTNDVIHVQFGVFNMKSKDTIDRIVDLRKLQVKYGINWADSNNAGLVESDFVPLENDNDLSIFRSEQNNASPVERVPGIPGIPSYLEYLITIVGKNLGEGGTSKFYLKAGIGPTTENQIMERAKISIPTFIANLGQIKYDPIPEGTRENLEDKVQNTEGRYIVKNSYFSVLRATTLFGDKNDGTITDVDAMGNEFNIGGPDAPSDGGINYNDIRQGQIGDCYLLACLMILADNEKDFIRAHLRENKQTERYEIDTFTQSGNETMSFAVASLFTHGISQAGLSGDYAVDSNNNKLIEVWPQVYEKAWANVRENRPTYGNIQAGVSTVPWRILTGKSSEAINVSTYNNQKIWDTIISQMTNQKPCYLVVGTKKEPTINDANYNIVGWGKPIGGHAYMIEGINTPSNSVVLRNPHGENHVLLPFSELSNVLNTIFVLYKQ
jgi:hypothetical protein